MPKPPRTSVHDLKFQLSDGSIVTAAQMLERASASKADKATPGPQAELPQADLQTVLDALLLLGGKAPILHLAQWLEMTGRERADGQPFGSAGVRDGLRQLVAEGRARVVHGGMTVVPLADHAERLQQLLQQPHRERLWRQRVHLLDHGHGDWDGPMGWITVRSAEEATSALRLMLFSGMGVQEFRRHLAGPLMALDASHHIAAALTQPWLPEAIGLMDAELRDGMLGQLLDQLPAAHPLRRQITDWLQGQHGELSLPMRVRLAEAALLALDFDRAAAHLDGLQGPVVTLLAARPT